MADLEKPKRASFSDRFHSHQGLLKSALNRYDATAFAIYVLIAALALLGRWRGGAVEILMGDAAAYSSAVAGRLEPYRFIGDSMLENPAITAFAQTALDVYLQYAAGPFGGLGSAFISLLLPAAFLQLLGFHLLARRFFASPLLAFGFAIVTLLKVKVGISGELWGLIQDPLSRILYQALFPWVLLLVLSNPFSLSVRIATMIASGVLVYIHSHSAATQAFALLCGFAALKPRNHTWIGHGLRLFGLGCLFLLIAAPFIFAFISTTSGGDLPDPALAREISQVRVGRYNTPWLMTPDFLRRCWPFLLAIGLGGWWLWRRRPDLHTFLLFVAGWAAGLAFIAIFLPSVEHAIAAHWDHLPFEYEFIRSLRYVVPVGWLFIFIVGWEIVRRRFEMARPVLVTALLATLVLVHNLVTKPQRFFGLVSTGAVCLVTGTVPCPRNDLERDVHKLLLAIKKLPEGSRFLPETDLLGLTIRHAARRPVVFTFKEGGWLMYAKEFDAMVNWYQRKKAFDELISYTEKKRKITDDQRWYSTFVRLAQEFGAQYIVMARDARKLSVVVPSSIVFASEKTSLLRVPAAESRTTR